MPTKVVSRKWHKTRGRSSGRREELEFYTVCSWNKIDGDGYCVAFHLRRENEDDEDKDQSMQFTLNELEARQLFLELCRYFIDEPQCPNNKPKPGFQSHGLNMCGECQDVNIVRGDEWDCGKVARGDHPR